MATPYQMQQMDKLSALEALTKGIVGQYGGGNDVKSVNPQNEAFAQGARQLGLTDAEIGAQLQGLPWNDQSRYIPAQGLRADELAPAPADAVAGGMPAPAAMPVQASAPAPAQRQTFLQRLGQGFDQAATAGLIDPSTLTKEQRRILRGQLLMNLGGALSQNRPVGEGFQQQYNTIKARQADELALRQKKAMADAFSGGIGNREQFMGVVQNLFAQGMIEPAMELLSKGKDLFPQPKYSTTPQIFERKDTGEKFAGVLSDTGEVKTLDGVVIPAEEVFIPVAEGGAVFKGQKGGSGAGVGTGAVVEPVVQRPKTPKINRQANVPGYNTPFYEGEDGTIYEWVD